MFRIRRNAHSEIVLLTAGAATDIHDKVCVVTLSGVSRIFFRGVLSFGLLYDCACVNPKCYPLRFPYAPGSASGCSFIDV